MNSKEVKQLRIVLIIISLILICACVNAATVIPPLAVTNANLGGGPLNQYTPGVHQGKGLHNIGILVKCWGRVTSVDVGGTFFYISDGSRGINPSGNEGIRVSITDLAPGNSISMPAVGQFLAITGISSTSAISVQSSNYVISTLRPRKQDDVRQIPF
jgi:hypothetical protein